MEQMNKNITNNVELNQSKQVETPTVSSPKNNVIETPTSSPNANEFTALMSELEKSKNQFQDLKNNCLNFFAKKYQVNLTNSHIDQNKLDFSDLEKLEHSFLQLCENNNIKFVSQQEKTEQNNFFNFLPKTKLYY